MMPYLSVKLRQPGDASFLQLKGVRKVVQTFPEEEDATLRSLYLLSIDPAEGDLLLALLRALPEVDFAEPVASRVIRRTKA